MDWTTLVTLISLSSLPRRQRVEMIAGVKEHEMHHRGQLMLMERMVGIVPHLTREMQARMASMNAQAVGKPA